jgi:serine/threonine protein kinase
MTLVAYQRYSVIGRAVGSGSFGVVFQAKVRTKDQTVAIKKVLKNDRYENREVEIISLFNHPNIVYLKHAFNFLEGADLYYNLELEFLYENIGRILHHYIYFKKGLPLIYAKLYMFQLLRALAYIHSMEICHRDIKPSNILIDPFSQRIGLVDFGSAKLLTKDKPNIFYICSRYYRAPELIIGANDYTLSSDMWSVGAVLGELLVGCPFFQAATGTEQFVEIIRVLGTPDKNDLRGMNKFWIHFRFPKLDPDNWGNVLPDWVSPGITIETINLIDNLLVFVPCQRIRSIEALGYVFFDELRKPGKILPNSKPLPVLFDFKKKEFDYGIRFTKKIIPEFNLSFLCRDYMCIWKVGVLFC